MVNAMYHFPKDFLWGAATASYQVEGNTKNCNWYTWEQAGKIINDQRSNLACDWWGGRWREDFDLASSGGHNAHRFSIEWSRVQPAPDRWDEDAIDRYREMLRGLNERGLTPMVTLHHFTEPLWITEIGSWENQEILPYFERYIQKIVEALKDYTNLWITINEPNILTVSSYILGDFPPGKNNLLSAGKVTANLVRAHAAAHRLIHQIQPNASVGIAHNFHSIKPKRSWSPLDRLSSQVVYSVLNEIFPNALVDGIVRIPFFNIHIPEAKGTQDFFGLNYYTRENIGFSLLRPKELFIRRSHNPQAQLSDTAMIANEPEGFFEAMKWSTKYKLPIIITENGVENADDSLRPTYLAQHIHQLWRAVNFNFPIKGYFHWTLVDNFEWERGWTQRFGLWELDIETQARRKRPSADFYSDICGKNGLSSDMVAKYAPAVLGILFP